MNLLVFLCLLKKDLVKICRVQIQKYKIELLELLYEGYLIL